MSLTEIAITHEASGTRATIAPERGGMVTSLDAAGRPILFLDRASLDDTTKNVRGGIPLLFPSPGKLEGDAWAHGALKQHGFARNLPWTVVAQRAEAITLRLVSSDATRDAYPWDFALDVTYRVEANALHLEARVENRGESAMPFGFGTHGYFAIENAASFTLASKATRAFDNVAKREVPFDASKLTIGAAEVDLHLVDHGASSIAFSVDGVQIAIDAPEHRRWVIWSVPGRPFVCVEPWTCPGNALTTGVDLIRLAPNQTHALTQTFRIAR